MAAGRMAEVRDAQGRCGFILQNSVLGSFSLLLCNILVLQHVVGILRFMLYICRLKIFGHNRQLCPVLLCIVEIWQIKKSGSCSPFKPLLDMIISMNKLTQYKCDQTNSKDHNNPEIHFGGKVRGMKGHQQDRQKIHLFA